MTMHKALDPRDDVNRLYVSRKEGRRGLASIGDSVDTSIQRFKDYIEKRGGRVITATTNNTNDTRTTRTGWAKRSTRNCARNWSLTQRTNGIFTIQNLSWRLTHILICDFEIQTDHLISARRIDKKENLQNCGLAVPVDHWVELKACEKKDTYLDLAKEVKQTLEHESDDYTKGLV